MKITTLAGRRRQAEDKKAIKKRLEYLRGELRAETLSWGDIAELESLKKYIDPDDVELLEAAGVPEFPEEGTTAGRKQKANDDCATDPRYWDCECQHNYIHPKSLKKCPLCGAEADEQPDSRVNEVEDWKKQKKAKVASRLKRRANVRVSKHGDFYDLCADALEWLDGIFKGSCQIEFYSTDYHVQVNVRTIEGEFPLGRLDLTFTKDTRGDLLNIESNGGIFAYGHITGEFIGRVGYEEEGNLKEGHLWIKK